MRRSFPAPKNPKNWQIFFYLIILSLISHQFHLLIKMSMLSNAASSPINITSSVDQSHISDSDNLSPARLSDNLSPSGASQPSFVTDRSVFLGTPALGSRLASKSPVLGSRAAHLPCSALLSHSRLSRSVAPTRYQDIELELIGLHEQYDILQAENSELKGKVEALK